MRNEARMEVRGPELLGPVLTRVIGMLAARAQFPIDRLDDALLVADAVAAHAPAYARDGRVVVSLAAEEGALEMTVADLRGQGAQGLLAESELPGVGNVLQRVADEVRVEDDGAGEALFIRLSFAG